MSHEQQKLKPFDLEMSEKEEGVFDQEMLVPVSESIKYRKRAQSAEHKAEELDRVLQDRLERQGQMETQLRELQVENELTRQLAQDGAVDMEVALLLAKKRVSATGDEEVDAKDIVQGLQQERPYLFSKDFHRAGIAGPTAGVRRGGLDRRKSLSELARRAQESGSRKDMQEYLRMRRSFPI